MRSVLVGAEVWVGVGVGVEVEVAAVPGEAATVGEAVVVWDGAVGEVPRVVWRAAQPLAKSVNASTVAVRPRVN
jgi:hypothetical protein